MSATSPKIGDKVWYRKGGQNWRGDISHVWSDTEVDLNIHGSVREDLSRDASGKIVRSAPYNHPDKDTNGNHVLLEGAHGAMLATTDADRESDGTWWVRAGRHGTNSQGRVEWFPDVKE